MSLLFVKVKNGKKIKGIDGSALSITKEGALTTAVHRVDRKSRDFD